MSLQKWLGFTPDLPSETAGAILECNNLIPSEKGMRAAPSLEAVGLDPLPDPAIGGTVAVYLDNTKRLIIGTADKLYEQTGSTFANVSRAGGYAAGTESRWRYTQFGNATMATNGTDEMQQSILTGNFANVPGTPPVCQVVETTQGFVFAFNNQSAAYGDEPDGWWCSALYDQANWTPSIATQCTKGRLIDTPGPIVGAKAFGTDIVAYKERSMFLGHYQGPPVAWGWSQVPGEIGAINHECIISVGTAHIFIGPDNFYVYDGTRPQPIGNVVRKWFFADLHPQFAFRIIGSHDLANGLIYWYYPSIAGDGTNDSAIVYSYKLDRWGFVSRKLQCAITYLSGQITYDNLGDKYATYDDLPAIPYDSPLWLQSKAFLALVDENNEVKTVSGPGENSSLTTGDFGDDWAYTTLTALRLRSAKAPTTGVMQHFSKPNLGDDVTADLTAALIDGRFDILVSARWHRARIDLTGSHEVVGFDPRLSVDGEH